LNLNKISNWNKFHIYTKFETEQILNLHKNLILNKF
jgi:hypothetical protein